MFAQVTRTRTSWLTTLVSNGTNANRRSIDGAVSTWTGAVRWGAHLHRGREVTELEGRIKYAQAKDMPLPDILVPLASGLLLLGSVGVLRWRAPRLTTAAIAAWFVAITPTMHEFWNQDEESRQTEQIQFLKNTALLGMALMLLVCTFSEQSPNEAT